MLYIEINFITVSNSNYELKIQFPLCKYIILNSITQCFMLKFSSSLLSLEYLFELCFVIHRVENPEGNCFCLTAN